jgi:hypothetical protein
MMKEDTVKRDPYWIVEAVDRNGKVIYSGQFTLFEKAWDKYYSFKGRNSVSLQRRYKEYKIA